MNKLSLELARKESMKMLDTDAFRPKINAVEINLNNSIEHELAKFLTVWAIRKGVPADCMIKFFEGQPNDEWPIETMLELFIERNGQKFKHDWERPQLVTESRTKEGARFDILVLDNAQRVEIVESCDKSTVPYDNDTVVIRI